MKHNIYIYILAAGLTSYLIRVLPLTLIRRPIRNVFLRSFLYYVPYATLAVMTFPAIVQATESPLSGFLALAAGMILSWHEKSLPTVAAVCCIVVFLTETFLSF